MTAPTSLAPEEVRPLRRVEYDKLVELGVFEGERVELLYGTVVTMAPRGARHDFAVEELTDVLVRALAGRARVRVQSAFAASDSSRPEPDHAVVPAEDYRVAHPAEAWLIVEVSETSLRKDRGLKAELYAQSGVPEYWVVNLPARLIEVHTDIVDGVYSRVTPYRPGEAVNLQQFPDVRVLLADVL